MRTQRLRRASRLGLLYAAIPVLAAVYDGYEVAIAKLDQHEIIDWLTVFVPRLSLALILAFVVYALFHAVGSLLERLHRAALSAQPTWQFLT